MTTQEDYITPIIVVVVLLFVFGILPALLPKHVPPPCAQAAIDFANAHHVDNLEDFTRVYTWFCGKDDE
jgi:hypothetical protein